MNTTRIKELLKEPTLQERRRSGDVGSLYLMMNPEYGEFKLGLCHKQDVTQREKQHISNGRANGYRMNEWFILAEWRVTDVRRKEQQLLSHFRNYHIPNHPISPQEMFNLKDGDTINLSLLEVLEDITGETELYETLFEGKHLLVNEGGVEFVLNKKLPGLFENHEVAEDYLQRHWTNITTWKDSDEHIKGTYLHTSESTEFYMENRNVLPLSHDWTYYARINWTEKTIHYLCQKRFRIDAEVIELKRARVENLEFRKPVQVEEFVQSICRKLEQMPNAHIEQIKRQQRLAEEEAERERLEAERERLEAERKRLEAEKKAERRKNANWWQRFWDTELWD